MMGVCSFFLSKDFDMFSNSNLKCPLRKGAHYHVYKLSPNVTNMPPLIPEGRWMLQIDFLYLNQYTFFSVQWYSGVEYINIFE
ncbi:hypothetical protein ILUMI_15300 [Ignelater luminosus]|uniref:Uncharacterized protein n=1 Tax=Ignelater luminosus TaxID=2038154 RepID=A0A8K0CNV1_IGNLU|nr:hypothetical protein ILUMI_15300 [Ignelater luminosus]